MYEIITYTFVAGVLCFIIAAIVALANAGPLFFVVAGLAFLIISALVALVMRLIDVE